MLKALEYLLRLPHVDYGQEDVSLDFWRSMMCEIWEAEYLLFLKMSTFFTFFTVLFKFGHCQNASLNLKCVAKILEKDLYLKNVLKNSQGFYWRLSNNCWVSNFMSDFIAE